MCQRRLGGGGGGGENSFVELDSLVAELFSMVVLRALSSVFVTLFLTTVETLNTRCHNAHPNVYRFGGIGTHPIPLLSPRP